MHAYTGVYTGVAFQKISACSGIDMRCQAGAQGGQEQQFLNYCYCLNMEGLACMGML